MASNLAKRSNGNNQIVKPSPLLSGTVTAQMLDRAVARTGKELSQGEAEDFYELLEREPGPAIRWAFMEHAKSSEFFPKPAQILTLIRSWQSMQAAEQGAAAKREEQADMNRRIAAGEKCFEWADVLKEFKRVIDGKTELPAEKKQELRKRVDEFVKGKRKSA